MGPEDLIAEYQHKINERIKTMPSVVQIRDKDKNIIGQYTQEQIRDMVDKALTWTPLKHEDITSNSSVVVIPDGNIKIWVTKILGLLRK